MAAAVVRNTMIIARLVSNVQERQVTGASPIQDFKTDSKTGIGTVAPAALPKINGCR